MERTAYISLPYDLLGTAEQFLAYAEADSLVIEVPSDYLDLTSTDNRQPEVLAIQRILTLTRREMPIRVIWNSRVAPIIFKSPPLFPLLAVVICLEKAAHLVKGDDGVCKEVDMQPIQDLIYKHRLQTDFFSDSQILLCADSRGHGRQKSLYSSRTGSLISREDFESLVDRLLAGQVAVNVSDAQAVIFSQNVATIVAELFENTDIHGRLGLDGKPIRINGMRGILFKRIKLGRKEKQPGGESTSGAHTMAYQTQKKGIGAALEISVFDSGIGFYSSFTRNELTRQTSLDDEWQIMHKCLARHYDEEVKDVPLFSDARPSHRCMGLYEVLRSLLLLKGKLEVRSGRAYGYRTFLEGDPKYQLESQDSTLRPGMPKPVLLDVERQFVTAPSAHEFLAGASIRILVPLQ